MKTAFLFLVPKPDFSSASILEGVRLGLSNSLLGLTSLSLSLSEMAAECLSCKRTQSVLMLSESSNLVNRQYPIARIDRRRI